MTTFPHPGSRFLVPGVLVALVCAAAVVAAQSALAPPSIRGVIRGRITTGDGTPVPRASVTVRGATSREALTVSTGDDGRYEMRDLAPGRYVVSAAKNRYLTIEYGQRRPRLAGRPIDVAPSATVEGIDIVLVPSGVIVVRVANEVGEAVAGVPVELYQLRMVDGRRMLTRSPVPSYLPGTDDRGEVRMYGLPPGDYYVLANVRAPASREYGPTYFPSSLSSVEASPVFVDAGAEVPAHITLLPVSLTSRISGVVLDLNGRPFRPRSLMLWQGNGSAVASRLVSVNDDGTFMMANVPPGSYTFAASGSETGVVEQTVEVPAAAHVSGLVVRATPGGVLRGRFVQEPAVPGANLREVPLAVPSVGPSETTARITRRADGTFEVRALAGKRLIRLAPNTVGWFLKAVRHQGRDVTDVPLDFGSGVTEIADVEVVVTTRGSDITGAVVDARGLPVADAVVVAFPDDRARWTPYSQSIGVGRPDQKGQFLIRDLPSGTYRVIAVPELEEGAERDLTVLDRLWARAERLSLGDAASATISLRLVE